MAKDWQRERTTALTGVDREALKLSVLTVTINKKRLTPALYRQLSEEAVIDEETGELRGMAVGWFNIHPKDGCPSVDHRHVLWGNGTHLRLATVVALEHDPRYQHQAQISQALRRDLIHLLALLLAEADQPYTLEPTTNPLHQLNITGYKLYVDSDVSTLLERLQQAKAQVLEDAAALQANEVARKNAQKTLERLAKQGITLTHPKLYQHESGLPIYGSYDSWSSQTLTERRTHGWKAYPLEHANEPDKALLYWKHRRDSPLDAQALATTLEPHILPLRVFIAERITTQHLQRIQEIALDLAKKLDLFPKESHQPSTKALRSVAPSTVWKHFEQEKKRFEDSSQLWQDHLDAISSLEQLFLL
jgi:hypothetical protein